MTVSAVTGAAQYQTAQPTQAEKSRQTLAGDMTTFLTLLTTQLQNQDPTSPMDTNEFTDQLTKYAGIEQQIATNDNLEALLAMQGSDRQLRALEYVGATVEAVGNTNRLVEGQDVEWIYALNDKAANVTVQVRDMNDKVVYSEDFVHKAGRNEFKWDGKDKDGKQLPDGNYFISIDAKDSDKNTVGYTPGIRGTVDSIDFASDTMYARIGDIQVNFDSITNVKRQSTVTPTDTTSGNSEGDGDGSETENNS